MSNCHPRGRSGIQRLGILAVAFLLNSGFNTVANAQGDPLEVIQELRFAGRYREAMDAALVHLRSFETRTHYRPHELKDAEHAVSTLTLILNMDEATRAQVASADDSMMAGDQHYGAGDFQAAARAFVDAFETYVILFDEDSKDASEACGFVAAAYDEEGDFGKADEYYARALRLQRRVLGDHPLVLATLNNMAYGLDEYRGEYERAEQLYRQIIVTAEALLGEDHLDVALYYNNLGAFLEQQHSLHEADEALTRALRIRENRLEPSHPDVLQTINNIATLRQKRHDYETAAESYRTVVERAQESGDTNTVDFGRYLSNLGSARHLLGEHRESEALHRRALAVRVKLRGENDPGLATNYYNLARVLHDTRQYDEALRYYDKALAMDESQLGGNSQTVARDLYYKALVFADRAQWGEAEKLLERSCESFEYARSRLKSPGLSQALFTADNSPYTSLAMTRLQQHDHEGAWVAVEKDRGRSLLDMLRMGRVGGEELQRERELLSRIRDGEDRTLALAEESTPEADDARASVRRELQLARVEWVSYQHDLSKKHPAERGGTYTLSEIQAALEEGSAIIGWLEDSDVYVVPKSGPVTWKPLGNDGGIDGDSDLRDSMSKSEASEDYKEFARAGYDRYLKPIEDQLHGVRRLYVVASGAMVGVPVEALMPDSDTYVIDRWQVCYVASATVLAALKEKSRSRGNVSILAVGDPPFSERHLTEMGKAVAYRSVDIAGESVEDAETRRAAMRGDREARKNLRRLGASRGEAIEIARGFPRADILVGTDASEQNLRALARDGLLKDYSHLHFATHAFSDDDDAERSCLILSQVRLPDPVDAAINAERIYDGAVTVGEILAEWELDADLVTLSACETALGQRLRGEGYVGFAHAFTRAGARSVVVSLWQVHDTVTSEFMKRFYANMLSGMTKIEALTEAKIALRDGTLRVGSYPTSRPFFWAPFVLIGLPE